MAKKVLLLLGGFSSEREVSLSAGKDIERPYSQRDMKLLFMI